MAHVRSQFHARALALEAELRLRGVRYSLTQDAGLTRWWRVDGVPRRMSTAQLERWLATPARPG